MGFAGLAFTSRAEPVPRCDPKTFRFEEDCSALKPYVNELTAPARLRFIPLNADDTIWLTLGGDYRAKIESLDRPNFGVAATNHAYTARGQRVYLDADLRSQAGARLFVEFSAAVETGRKPERSFDRSDIDLAQGFVDLPLPIAGAPSFIRAGRQELDLGGNRLVSTRDPANLRRAFDMVRLELDPAGVQIVAFWGRPVLNGPKAFDDHAPVSETLYGLTLRAVHKLVDQPQTLDLFFLARDRATATFEDATGRDRRRTLGVRAAGRWRGADYAIQTAYQFGEVGPDKVSAYGVAGDLGWRWSSLWAKPRLGVSFGLASGDRRRGDGRLNSYDPLYPNLSYFTDAPEAYPVNIRDLQPNLTLALTPTVEIKVGQDFLGRDSKNDAVYGANGLPFLTGPLGSDLRAVATLSSVHATWRLQSHLQLDIGIVHGAAGRLIQEAHGRDLNYAMTQIEARF